MALDNDHRKIIVGSTGGQIKVFDLLSGVKINDLDPHNEENGEVSFIGYADGDGTIITTSWDMSVKIHRDDRDEALTAKENVLRGLRGIHRKDIISGDYAHNLGLIVTGGRDSVVKLWDYDKMRHTEDITAHRAEVKTVKFL